MPRTAAVAARVPRRLPARLPDRLLQPRDRRRRSPSSAKGMVKFADPLPVPRAGRRLPRAALASASTGARSAWFFGGIAVNAVYGVSSCSRRRPATTSTPSCSTPLTRRREPDQHLRRRQRLERLPAERAHRRPEPPGDRADPPAARPRADLPAARARAPAAAAARGPARRSCSWSSSRRSRAAGCSASWSARSCSLVPYRHLLFSRAAAAAARGSSRSSSSTWSTAAATSSTSSSARGSQTGGRSTSAHFGVYDFVPQVLHRTRSSVSG